MAYSADGPGSEKRLNHDFLANQRYEIMKSLG
jgi:hypothetical protein